MQYNPLKPKIHIYDTKDELSVSLDGFVWYFGICFRTTGRILYNKQIVQNQMICYFVLIILFFTMVLHVN